MAEALFFDLSKIDLAGVAISTEEIGRLNPQCGDMRQLDYVIWALPDFSKGLGVKKIRPDEFWVSGHIPGRPLFPGVLMIEAGAQLCSVLQKKKVAIQTFLGFVRCDEVIFRGQVVPGDTLYLLAREVKSGARRFCSQVQGVVSDKLVFECQITGMAM